MNFHVLTLFPEMIEQGVATSITGRALEQNIIKLNTVNIRDFSEEKHGKVDDYTYGGGAGMLMQAEPVYKAFCNVEEAIPKSNAKRVIYVTPQGETFTQQKAKELSQADDLVFLCGHYEGIDERVLEEVVTDYISIGDYVLTGGELAAMVMIDAIARLVPGVLHNEASAETESFHGNLLEYPQYSRPSEWHGKKVPDVLMSGNQKLIDKWRLEKSIERTKERRPDLYEKYQALEACKEALMKQKLLHIDMIELINRGQAKLLIAEEGQYLIENIQTGVYYFANLLEHEELVIEDLLKNDCISRIVVHGESDAIKISKLLEIQPSKMNIIDINKAGKYYLSTYTKKEKAPVTGLYRPDGKPMDSGTTAGLRICVLDEDNIEAVSNEWIEGYAQYLEKLVANEQLIGAFIDDKLVGIAGYNDGGDIGLLYVSCDYRRKHIAMALMTYLINDTLDKGQIPYCIIDRDNDSMINLQKKLGMYLSKGLIYTFF